MLGEVSLARFEPEEELAAGNELLEEGAGPAALGALAGAHAELGVAEGATAKRRDGAPPAPP